MNVLESKRIYLRELVKNDVDMLFKLHNNKATMKYMPYDSISFEKAKYDLAEYSDISKTQPGLGIWATILKSNNEVIGWTCLKKLPNTDDVEIGYRYFPKFWNKGYCTEICIELVRYGFEKLNLDEIIAIVRPENIASIKVIEKLNMNFIKMVHHYGMNLKQYIITREQY